MCRFGLLVVAVAFASCGCHLAPESPPDPVGPYVLYRLRETTNVLEEAVICIDSGAPNAVVQRLEKSLRLEDESGRPVPFQTTFLGYGQASTPQLRVVPVAPPKGWLTLSIPWSSDWEAWPSRLDRGLSNDPVGKRWFVSYLPGESRPGLAGIRISNDPAWFGYADVSFSEGVAAPVPFHDAIEAFGPGGAVLSCVTPNGADGVANSEFALKCSDRVAKLKLKTAIESVPGGVPFAGAPGMIDFMQWNHVVDRNGDDVYENPATTW